MEKKKQQNGRSQSGTILEKQQPDKNSVSWDNPSQLADKKCPEEIAILLEEWPEQIVNAVLVEDHGPMLTEGYQADDYFVARTGAHRRPLRPADHVRRRWPGKRNHY